jgi:3-mercaptopyruvate sulfurtransferase SseA
VALTLQRRGIKAVRPLAGGFEWWQNRNYPLAGAAGTAAVRGGRASEPLDPL